MPKAQTVTERLRARLVKIGLSERKAKEYAAKLGPTVAGIIRAATAPKDTPSKAKEPPTRAASRSATQNWIALDPKNKTGLDLTKVLPWDWKGPNGVQPLRVMHGLSSTASYVVVATKGKDGVLAIRRWSQYSAFNVKFYPTLAYWNVTQEELRTLGGSEYLQREPYERMHMPFEAVHQLLELLTPPKRATKLRKLITVLTPEWAQQAIEALRARRQPQEQD